jgi:hypothetical protein
MRYFNRLRPSNHQLIGRLHADDFMTAAVQLRSIKSAAAIQKRIDDIAEGRAGLLDPTELPQWTGASEQDVDLVSGHFEAHGLTIQRSDVDINFGIVRLGGGSSQFEAAFGVENNKFDVGGQIFRAPRGIIKIPLSLHGIVTSVHRLDKTPIARPFHVHATTKDLARVGKIMRATDIYRAQGVPVDQIAQQDGVDTWYITLGGDSNRTILKAIEFYCKQTGITMEEYFAIAVAGASIDGSPTDPATVEVILDAIAHAALPGRKEKPGSIRNFVAGNDDDSFVSAAEAGFSFKQAGVELRNGSNSWGSRFDNFPQASLTSRWPRAAQGGALVGRYLFAASGDDGATDIRFGATNDGKGKIGPHAKAGATPFAGKPKFGTDAPGCIPGIIDVGGQLLNFSADGSTVTSWTVWTSAGCGVGPFGQTEFEKALGVAFKSANPDHAVGNGCPTIVDNADPGSGPETPIPDDQGNFSESRVGGTSNAAPAACKKASAATKPGTPLLDRFYKGAGTRLFRRSTGKIGPYTADPNAKLDDCQGLGEPVYSEMAAL